LKAKVVNKKTNSYKFTAKLLLASTNVVSSAITVQRGPIGKASKKAKAGKTNKKGVFAFKQAVKKRFAYQAIFPELCTTEEFVVPKATKRKLKR